MVEEFMTRNTSSTLVIGAGYSKLLAGLEVSTGPLLVFSHFLAVWTLVLASRAIVGEVIFLILSEKLYPTAVLCTYVLTSH